MRFDVVNRLQGNAPEVAEVPKPKKRAGSKPSRGAVTEPAAASGADWISQKQAAEVAGVTDRSVREWLKHWGVVETVAPDLVAPNKLPSGGKRGRRQVVIHAASWSRVMGDPVLKRILRKGSSAIPAGFSAAAEPIDAAEPSAAAEPTRETSKPIEVKRAGPGGEAYVVYLESEVARLTTELGRSRHGR